MRIVVLKLEVFVFETEDVLYIGIDTHGGQRTWVAGELQFHLFEVVHVDVCVTQCVDEVRLLCLLSLASVASCSDQNSSLRYP